MKILYNHILFGITAILLLLFSACNKAESFSEEGGDGNTPIVYLSVTRAQAEGVHSFNADGTDYEDRVHDLAMLVFDSSTGEKVCEYFDENIPFSYKEKMFTVRMKPGQRDFYFVANMPMNELKAITDRGAMLAYMSTFRMLDNELYFGAKEAKGFPMSRIYSNQTVTEGGTIMNPKPFKPVNTSSVVEDQVRLMRTVAKIEINLSGATDAIQEVTYHNAQSDFLIGFSSSTPYNDINLKIIENTANPDVTKHVFYVPERLINDENITWNQSMPNIPINYFVIKTKAGRVFNIPILWNGEDAKENYLKFARKEEMNNDIKPNYSVARNQHYQFNVTVPADDKEILVTAAVLPWTLVQSEMSYTTPKYAGIVSFPNGGGEVMDDNQTVWLHQQNVAKVSFKLIAPKGGIWRATLNNGLDFSLYPDPSPETGETGATMGIANPDVFYTMYIKPIKPFQGTPRLTELYITVNGEEVQIVPNLYATDTPPGPGKRPIFKQVE